MPYRQISIGVVFVALAASVLAIVPRVRVPTLTGSVQRRLPHDAIEVIRLTPAGEPTDAIKCDALERVEFTYQVLNHGETPITGLRLGTQCACEQVGDPPEKILPGESATISFRLRAPRAGIIQRRVPLLADGVSEPLVVFDASLRVNFYPPELLSPTEGLRVTFIKGDDSPRECVFETIEVKESPFCISGLGLVSAGIQVLPSRTEELPEADPALTRRRYHFPLVNQSLPLGRHIASGTLHIGPQIQMSKPLAISADVVDPVTVVPNPVVIKHAPGSAPPSRRVCVINRTGKRVTAEPIEYDQELMRIDPAGANIASIAAFGLVPLQMPDSAVETKVVFSIGNGETRELAVRFEPSERP